MDERRKREEGKKEEKKKEGRHMLPDNQKEDNIFSKITILK